ncbi:hypothetical protein [Brevibacillus reuszeri]|uniref:hypothetical protein n=1 Tax=Brevibacillus reuszeri TaxID=54915 RepID=UPI000CCC32A6|nr:hypothetical protein [Brevibacillus reuszeri]
MNQVEQSKLTVAQMIEGKEYVFTECFFNDRSNEITIIKKEGDKFFVTYSGGEFIQDQTVIFNDESFYLFDFNIDVSTLTLWELEEASVELYNLFMSNAIDEDMKENVQVI